MSKFGWVPDTPDFKDQLFQVSRAVALPLGVDLRPKMAPMWDQEDLGSCTGQSIAAAFEYMQVKSGLADFRPSAMFIYFNARKMEGTVESDSGATIRNAIKTVNRIGVVSEKEWPYEVEKFAVHPSKKVIDNARFHRSLRYQRVAQNLFQIKQCLAQGFPIVFGFAVYDSFMSAETEKTGMMQMPTDTEDMLGGHAVLAVGYIVMNGWLYFICRNSWSEKWGKNGYFFMPAKYMLDSNLSADLWCIQLVGGLQ